MPPRSSSTAGATYLDKGARIEELRLAARRAADRMPSIRRVRLFGSLVAGIPTPRSDADLVVIVGSSPYAEPRDRLPDMLRALSPLPCPIDLRVLTEAEVERLRAEGSPLLRRAVDDGIDLL